MAYASTSAYVEPSGTRSMTAAEPDADAVRLVWPGLVGPWFAAELLDPGGGGAVGSRALPLADCVGQVSHPLRWLRADRVQGHAACVHALEQAHSGAEQHR